MVDVTPGRSLCRYLFWSFCWMWVRLWLGVCYRLRVTGKHHVPRQGSVLVVANHQSFFDPLLVGAVSYPRPLVSLARSTLFRFPLGILIRALNAVPIDRGKGDTKAMKTCIQLLNEELALLIFPEGTRTDDGEVKTFKAGPMLLIKRAKPLVLPVAIEGAFKTWPRRRKLPHLFGRIRVHWGEPIQPETLLAMDTDEAMALLRQRVAELQKVGTDKQS